LPFRIPVYLVASFAVVAWSVALTALGVAPVGAITSADAIARINALRAANGIPGVVEDPALSVACQAHARYMAINGGWDRRAPHDEKVSKPGYSPDGADAARHSLLAGPDGWRDPHPWATAPFHRRQMLDPGLTRTGYGENRGWACLQTITEPRRAIGDHIYTFPGPGATDVPTSETAAELDSGGSSHVPGDSVGLPAGTTTGPNLIVYTPGPVSPEYKTARLTGPNGPVPAVIGRGFVIPRRPLEPGTQYSAEVDLYYPVGYCTPRGMPFSNAAEDALCPLNVATWCDAQDPSVGWIVEPPVPPRLCAPGETSPDGPVVLPERAVTHRWAFTTRGSANDRARCRQTLTAPRRIGRRTAMVVRFRTCASTTVVARVYRIGRTRGKRPKTPLIVKRSRTRPAVRSRLRVPTERLAPGRYRLKVSIQGTTPKKRITQLFTIKALHPGDR
jgi:hypothetical protein